MTLSELAGGRDNNLNLIRIIAAICVLISHSYPITLGRSTTEPLLAMTGLSLGTLAVYVFFAISGFLITQSFASASTITEWVAARALRILPGLAVAAAITAFALGPLVTALPSASYFGQTATWTYVPRNVLLFDLQYTLPGVFYSNIYGPEINGSLWTLMYEVLCYLGVLIAGILGLIRSRLLYAFALCAFVALYLASTFLLPSWVAIGGFGQLMNLGLPFAIGSALYVWRDRVRLSWLLGAGVAAIAAIASHTELSQPALVGAICYWVFLVGYKPKGAIRVYNRFGDYSYGTYIYAFPTQQSIVHLVPGIDPLSNIILALPVTLILACLSWHFVERPALALKSRFRRPRGAAARPSQDAAP